MAISRTNSERYPDPTAYAALTAVEKSECGRRRKHIRKKRFRNRIRKEVRDNESKGLSESGTQA